MKKPTNILFLDVDGVLVNRKSLMRHSGIDAKGDPDCVAALNRIIAETDARVVVSSCWRIGTTLPWLRETLRSWGVRAKVIGKTPDFKFTTPRGHEIEAWLAEFSKGREVGRIVILDDDADMDGLSKFLVQTEFEPGLTDDDAGQAIKILKGGVTWQRQSRTSKAGLTAE